METEHPTSDAVWLDIVAFSKTVVESNLNAPSVGSLTMFATKASASAIEANSLCTVKEHVPVVIRPVLWPFCRINGVGREGDSRIDAHIASSFFGKKNAWTEMIANALRNEVDGKVSVFYLDSNEAKTIQNRLARDAFNIGRSELQSLSRSNASSTWHSITDAGSPVNGGISDQTQM